jgi:hypothetical protein
MGRGANPVAMFRTSWTDPDAVYLAIKGGSPGVNHGHMDIGSFVLDADGVRWALDLGPESYNKIESRGMNLWGRSQDSERWTIFRYNNYSHNTLVVDGQLQRVPGYAPIVRFSPGGADAQKVVIDMTSVYAGQLGSALRGAELLNNGQVLIQDEFCAVDGKRSACIVDPGWEIDALHGDHRCRYPASDIFNGAQGGLRRAESGNGYDWLRG